MRREIQTPHFYRPTLARLQKLTELGVSVYSCMSDMWENMRVCLRTSLCCLSLSTVILQEHSNCPIHRHRGPFIAPMTKRSILQHQRCRPPLFEQTIRRRVRWPGWTMLEMTFPASLSLSLSPTFSVCDCWWRVGHRSEHIDMHIIVKSAVHCKVGIILCPVVNEKIFAFSFYSTEGHSWCHFSVAVIQYGN